jgi:hypothetical protein
MLDTAYIKHFPGRASTAFNGTNSNGSRISSGVRDTDEARQWENRIVKCEQVVLKTLMYDIYFPGTHNY